MVHSPSLAVIYDVAALREQQFPVTRDTVYLNHAGISPLPRRTFQAMQDMNELLMLSPVKAFQKYQEREMIFLETLRGLINAASTNEIVGVQSTSLGLNLVAQAISWQAGQNIVLCDVEFPSNVYPWLRLQEQHGVEARTIPHSDGGLTVDALHKVVDDKTRMITVSAIQFFTGHRTDLTAVGEFCRERGIIFAVDAIQAAGHMPIDVQAMNISILSSGGQKSLMGPCGQGFLYVRSELAEQMMPTFVGPNAVDDFLHWLKYKLTPRPAAKRFAMGTFNVSGVIGLLESVTMLRELGVSAIDTYVTALADYTIERLKSAGYEVITPAVHGPIVTFRAAPTEPETVKLVEGLSARNVVTVMHWDQRNIPHIRVSLHCYNTVADIDRFFAILQEVKLS